jgi:ankyrin repeat protein
MQNNRYELNHTLIDTTKSNQPAIIKKLQADEVHKLIINGADVNYRDHYDYSPLMYAAYFGNDKVAKTLLEHGADPITKNKFGRNALSYAQSLDRVDIMNLLRDYYAI